MTAARAGREEGGRGAGAPARRGGGAESSRAERSGHRRPPPGCSSPRAAPPPALPAVPGGPRSARGRGSHSRSRRREQRAGARKHGESSRPSWSAGARADPGQGPPAGELWVGSGCPRSVGRGFGPRARGHRLGLRTAPNWGLQEVTSPGLVPASVSSPRAQRRPGPWLAQGGGGRSGSRPPLPGVVGVGEGAVSGTAVPPESRCPAVARTRPRGWAGLGAPWGWTRRRGLAGSGGSGSEHRVSGTEGTGVCGRSGGSELRAQPRARQAAPCG